ncbi:MAG: glycoside hydrolase family 16 protein [Bacteroidales bacterium]|jgi:beta-glucanase (GH16 family)|nr:glycoside hydrolase family 16 protein [Bacteroidales bacterium]
MKKKLSIITLACLFIIPALGQHYPQDKNWNVIFEDVFNSLSSRWYTSHSVHGEPQHYIPANVSIENGKLVLTAKAENYHCTNPNCNCGGDTYSYTSGQIVSYNYSQLYHYGYYEIHAKLPTGTGLFPAFWLWASSGDDWYNEIDIMEANGCRLNETSSNYREDPQDPQKDAVWHYCNNTNGFHWYGVEWDRDKITWYRDKKIVRQVTHTGLQHRMQLIINLALFPDSWNNGCPVSSTMPPAYMYVDTANAYQLICHSNISVSDENNVKIDFENGYSYGVKKSISLSGVSSLTTGQNVSLRATDFIELKNDFYVPSGAELYLDINPCEARTNREKQVK